MTVLSHTRCCTGVTVITLCRALDVNLATDTSRGNAPASCSSSPQNLEDHVYVRASGAGSLAIMARFLKVWFSAVIVSANFSACACRCGADETATVS